MATQEGAARTFDLSLVTPEGAGVRGRGGDADRPRRVRGDRRARAPRAARRHAQGRGDPGEVGGEWHAFAAGPGYFKVQQDRALVLVDDAVRAEEIDVEEARREADEARALLEEIDAGADEHDRWKVEQRLRHAENKLAVAGHD